MSHNCEEFDQMVANCAAHGLPIPDTACSNHNALRHGVPGEPPQIVGWGAFGMYFDLHPSAAATEQPDVEAIRRRNETRKPGHQIHARADCAWCAMPRASLLALDAEDVDALLTEIERYKAMVASEHETLTGIIREGETPLDAIRRVVGENERLRGLLDRARNALTGIE